MMKQKKDCEVVVEVVVETQQRYRFHFERVLHRQRKAIEAETNCGS